MKIRIVVYAIDTNNSIAISSPMEICASLRTASRSIYATWLYERMVSFELSNKDYFMMAWEAMERVSIKFEEIKVADGTY